MFSVIFVLLSFQVRHVVFFLPLCESSWYLLCVAMSASNFSWFWWVYYTINWILIIMYICARCVSHVIIVFTLSLVEVGTLRIFSNFVIIIVKAHYWWFDSEYSISRINKTQAKTLIKAYNWNHSSFIVSNLASFVSVVVALN